MNNSEQLLKFLLIFFFSILFLQIHAQQSVYLESSEKGRGVLKSRGNECFVITPAHVVKESIKNISITGEKNVLSKGRLVQILAPDLAIIRVTEGGTQNCDSWSMPKNYFTILDNSIEGYLELVQTSGSKKRVQVFISEKDEEIITIEPKRVNQPFLKGMSGASLFTQYDGKKIFLGMLQEVDENGNGYVYQADDMERILGGFFGDKTTKPKKIVAAKKVVKKSRFYQINQGISIDLLSVNRKGNTVSCKFKLTSLDKNQKVSIHRLFNGGTRMFDQYGFETFASTLKIGTNYSNNLQVKYDLKKNLPVEGEITFKDVRSDAEGITFMRIFLKGNNSNSIFFQFRNISFEGFDQPLVLPKMEKSKFNKENENLKIDIVNIQKKGVMVRINFKVTSLKQDQTITTYKTTNGGTRMFDQNGRETIASNLKLGNKMDTDKVTYPLIKGVPLDGEFTFNNIYTGATSIAFLRLYFTGSKSGSSSFAFTNINFE